MDNNKKTILIVDDSALNRTILSEILHDQYNLMEACDGHEAIEVIQNNLDTFHLILLDLVMPGLDGMGVLQKMNQEGWIENLPVIMISSETISSFITRAYDLGACDYIARPYDSDVVLKRIANTLMLYTKQKQLQDEITRQVNARERENRLMIDILSHIVEYRNGESDAHVLHINQFTNILFQEIFRISSDYDEYKEDLDLICTASALHDIGKIGIPEEILNKPGRLTPEEFAIMKTHTTIGRNMIDKLPDIYKDEKLVYYARNICLSHHEKWDGGGYPNGLKGNAIPLCAQVVSLADVYDALTSERCYKPAYDHDKAIEMILHNECGTFNPLLIEALQNISNELKESKHESSRIL